MVAIHTFGACSTGVPIADAVAVCPAVPGRVGQCWAPVWIAGGSAGEGSVGSGEGGKAGGKGSDICGEGGVSCK